MKKLSKMAALGLALTLTFGMNVNAATSVTTEGVDVVVPPEVMQEYEDKASDYHEKVLEVTGGGIVIVNDQTVSVADVVKIDETPLAAETVYEAEQKAPELVAAQKNKLVEDLVATAQLPTNATINTDVAPVQVAAASVSLPEGAVIPEGESIELTIKFDFEKKPNKVYILLHLNSSTGAWETIVPSSVGADGNVTASFSSLSPILLNELDLVLVEVGEDKDGGSDDNGGSNDSPAADTTNPGTSPKTAETLPVAGVMALICLAGAAVCANKIRYNK